jgi:hypothetical protein
VKTYLHAKLAELGLEPSDVTLEQLEDHIVVLEKANDIV